MCHITVVALDRPIVSGHRNYSVRVDAKVVIRCVVEPVVNSVTWYKDNYVIQPSRRFEGGTPDNPSLTIVRVRKGDAGQYVCGASNSLGVESKVEARHTSSKYTGGNVSTPALTIINLTSEDAGSYRCGAKNDVGDFESRFLRLRVMRAMSSYGRTIIVVIVILFVVTITATTTTTTTTTIIIIIVVVVVVVIVVFVVNFPVLSASLSKRNRNFENNNNNNRNNKKKD
nr:hypothetical protein BaRGS_034865 [Batillaria attramentaria]